MSKVNNLIPCGIMTGAVAVFYGAETHEWVGTTILISAAITMGLTMIFWNVSKWLTGRLFPDQPGDVTKAKRWGNNGRAE